MNESSKITSGERATDMLLKFASPVAFLLIALPAPLYFLLRYFTATEDAAVWMLFAITSLGIGVVAGLAIALILLLYRRRWLRQMRDKLAQDGITVNELSWFEAELTATERSTLRGIKQGLLADAYRETLAARLTATRLSDNTTRSLALVERRLQQTRNLSGTERPQLERELAEDRARLQRTHEAARRQRAEAETRLQSIAAAASRQQTDAETRVALERLNAASGAPLALENAKLQREYEDQFRAQLAKRDETSS